MRRARPEKLVMQRAVAAALPAPAVLPLFDRMLSVGPGTLALRRFLLPDDRDADWVVVSSQGRALARWRLPAGLRVLAGTLERVIGVEAYADGVESLIAYTLCR